MIRSTFWKGFRKKETVGQSVARRFPRWISPNLLTVLRIVLIAPIVWAINNGAYGWAMGLFFAAFVLDFMDGPLARVQNRVTVFGKLFDPFADKAVFLTVLLVAGFDRLPNTLIWTIVLLEALLVVLALSVTAVMRKRTVNRKLGANIFGKLKMSAQVLGVLLLLLPSQTDTTQALMEAVLWIAVGLAVLSIVGHIAFRPGADPSQSP